MIDTVPDKPKTPISSFRIPTELKDRAAAKATAEGRTLTDVVVESLERYVKRQSKH
jgi:predicted DNA-binding protein